MAASKQGNDDQGAGRSSVVHPPSSNFKMMTDTRMKNVRTIAGFLDGPRVLSNMALHRWFPAKFAMLSDRLITQKGILMMGGAGH